MMLVTQLKGYGATAAVQALEWTCVRWLLCGRFTVPLELNVPSHQSPSITRPPRLTEVELANNTAVHLKCAA